MAQAWLMPPPLQLGCADCGWLSSGFPVACWPLTGENRVTGARRAPGTTSCQGQEPEGIGEGQVQYPHLRLQAVSQRESLVEGKG